MNNHNNDYATSQPRQVNYFPVDLSCYSISVVRMVVWGYHYMMLKLDKVIRHCNYLWNINLVGVLISELPCFDAWLYCLVLVPLLLRVIHTHQASHCMQWLISDTISAVSNSPSSSRNTDGTCIFLPSTVDHLMSYFPVSMLACHF